MNKIKTTISIPTEFNFKEDGNKATIEVYPFEKGFGVSVAHPIRRTLISSSVGYAPVALQIEGVKHEFDSLKGMLEDVASFIINLKNVRFKINADEVKVNYSFNGPREIRGEDLITDEVDVVTPNEYIATLNEEANLNFTLIIKKGMGFVPVENFRDEIEEGFIGLDAYFTPVKRVVYNIENILVEDDPNYEKVVFEVETDGQISPVEAFKDAVAKYLNQFAVFSKEISLPKEEKEVKLSDEYNILFESIDKLNLRSRAYNALKDRAGINYIGELILMGKEKISHIKNLGAKSLEEIYEKLDEIGFNLDKQIPLDIKKAIEEKLKALKGE